MPDTTIELPHDFVEAFISYANARQLAATHFDAAVLESPLDLGVHDNGLRLSLSNNYPGCSPFLRMTTSEGHHYVEVGAYYSSVLNTETQTRSLARIEIHGRRDINLNYPLAWAIAAYDLWIAHS
jgi:hypothetical protein